MGARIKDQLLRIVSADPTECLLTIAQSDLGAKGAYGQECLICEEHCPVAEKAIKVVERRTPSGAVVGAPLVDPALCIGCGLCQNKCPSRPDRAIRVHPHCA